MWNQGSAKSELPVVRSCTGCAAIDPTKPLKDFRGLRDPSFASLSAAGYADPYWTKEMALPSRARVKVNPAPCLPDDTLSEIDVTHVNSSRNSGQDLLRHLWLIWVLTIARVLITLQLQSTGAFRVAGAYALVVVFLRATLAVTPIRPRRRGSSVESTGSNCEETAKQQASDKLSRFLIH